MQKEVDEDHVCSICLTLYFKPVYLRNCKHIFCQPCIEQATQYAQDKRCPLCRNVFKNDDILPHHQLAKIVEQNYPDQLKQKAKSIRERITYNLLIGNVTQFLKQPQINKYQWTLYVKPAPGQLPLEKYAQKVQLFLHPTFNPSTLKFKANENIQLRRRGWGTFRIQIKVTWKKQYGGYTDLFHDLQFKPKVEKIRPCKLLIPANQNK